MVADMIYHCDLAIHQHEYERQNLEGPTDVSFAAPWVMDAAPFPALLTLVKRLCTVYRIMGCA